MEWFAGPSETSMAASRYTLANQAWRMIVPRGQTEQVFIVANVLVVQARHAPAEVDVDHGNVACRQRAEAGAQNVVGRDPRRIIHAGVL